MGIEFKINSELSGACWLVGEQLGEVWKSKQAHSLCIEKTHLHLWLGSPIFIYYFLGGQASDTIFKQTGSPNIQNLDYWTWFYISTIFWGVSWFPDDNDPDKQSRGLNDTHRQNYTVKILPSSVHQGLNHWELIFSKIPTTRLVQFKWEMQTYWHNIVNRSARIYKQVLYTASLNYPICLSLSSLK